MQGPRVVWSRQWWTTTTTGPITRVLRNKAPLKAMPGSTVIQWGVQRGPGWLGGSTRIQWGADISYHQHISNQNILAWQDKDSCQKVGSNPLVGADTYLNIFLWFLAAPAILSDKKLFSLGQSSAQMFNNRLDTNRLDTENQKWTLDKND